MTCKECERLKTLLQAERSNLKEVIRLKDDAQSRLALTDRLAEALQAFLNNRDPSHFMHYRALLAEYDSSKNQEKQS